MSENPYRSPEAEAKTVERSSRRVVILGGNVLYLLGASVVLWSTVGWKLGQISERPDGLLWAGISTVLIGAMLTAGAHWAPK